MTRFLLDANLSPRTARRLSLSLSLDVESLLERGLGELPDPQVRRIARAENRVIITLDRDFLEPWLASGRIDVGVIYLDLPARLRYISTINDILERFFLVHAPSVDLDHSVVVIREYEVFIETENV